MNFTKAINLVSVATNAAIIYYADVAIEPILMVFSIISLGVFIDLSLNQKSA